MKRMESPQSNEQTEKAVNAFSLLSRTGTGILSTISLAVEGYPFGSLTPFCLDENFYPNILISGLAQHTKNIIDNPKVSLTVTETSSETNKQAKGRLTYIGDAEIVKEDEEIKRRYTNYFPESKDYFKTHDFSFYRIIPKRIRYIGGFGKIYWLEPEEIKFQNLFHGETEEKIISHMNEDHQHNIHDYLSKIVGVSVQEDDKYWLAGLDQFGTDIMLNGKLHRIQFETAMNESSQARTYFVDLAKKAKQS